MITQTEALKMAIEHIWYNGATTERKMVLNACKEALQSQEQEPVAWTDLEGNFTSNPKELSWYPYPLYTRPTPKKPQYLYVSKGLDGKPDFSFIDHQESIGKIKLEVDDAV